jgi:hypothetical protein
MANPAVQQDLLAGGEPFPPQIGRASAASAQRRFALQEETRLSRRFALQEEMRLSRSFARKTCGSAGAAPSSRVRNPALYCAFAIPKQWGVRP